MTSCNPQTHIFAAGTAAIVSTVAVQPLDVLKTRLQVSSVSRSHAHPHTGITRHLRSMFSAEGVKGLYRGVCPTLFSVVPSISIYLTLYDVFKRQFNGIHNDGAGVSTAFRQSMAAGLASCCTTLITNPLWVVKTRMQIQSHTGLGARYHNMAHTFRSIVSEEGIRGLYKGLGASFMNSSNAMIYFPMYEIIKARMCKRFKSESPHAAFCYLTSASISAALACAVTYPSEVVRSRLQIQGSRLKVASRTGRTPSIQYKGVLDAFRVIYKCEGMYGLYRGMFTNLMRLVPAQAISFTVYEMLLRMTTGR